jgi:hypothetical protein
LRDERKDGLTLGKKREAGIEHGCSSPAAMKTQW